MRELEFVAVIPNDQPDKEFTLYLLEKTEKIIVPICVNKKLANDINSILCFSKVHSEIALIRNILRLGKMRFEKFLVNDIQDGKYNCKFLISKGGQKHEMEIDFESGVLICLAENKNILISNKVLYAIGYRLTEDIIREALE